MTTPTEAITSWLSEFDQALSTGDIDGATALFADECYWRDLVTFTWNIKTVEGHDGVGDMLAACLERTAPSGWALEGEATEADGVIDGWIRFETGVARGNGHIRLLDGKCFTLLTAMTELKGHEEPAGGRRPSGVEHGADPDRETWLEKRGKRPSWGTPPSPIAS